VKSGSIYTKPILNVNLRPILHISSSTETCIIFSILSVSKRFLLIAQKRSVLFHLAWQADCCIIAKKWDVVADIFRLEGTQVFDMGLFKSSSISTSTANRTWSAIVPLCRRRINRNVGLA